VSRRRVLFAAGCAVLLSGAPGLRAAPAAAPDRLVQAWTADSNYFPREAHRLFTEQARADGHSRVARLGTALSLLTYPPTTDERIGQARAALRQLADSGDDEPALAARYFLGRIAQIYQSRPDYAAAADQYRALAGRHGETYWGQLALAKLGILILYALPAPAAPAARLTQAEALLPRATPPTACDLHLMMADAALYYGLPAARALQHLLAADALGVPSDITRANVWVQIIELSAQLGERARAEAYGHRFFTAFPRDARRYAIEQKLAAVAAGDPDRVP
jgi:hypothetical protein